MCSKSRDLFEFWEMSRVGSWSLRDLRLESDCGPLVHIFTYSSGFFPENVKYYIRTSNVHLYQVKRLHSRLRHQIPRILKNRKFLQDHKFSLEISGPKVILVLLSKFSLYWAVQRFSLMDDPVLEIK